MLRALREGTNSWPVRILLILIVASFALWGVQTGQIGGASSVARVGDTRVTQQAYSRQFNSDFARLQSEREGQYTVQDAVADGVDEAILDRLVLLAALDQGAKDIGLRVSTERTKQAIQELPIFLDPEGRFDLFTYEQELRNRQHTTASFERDIRKDLSRGDLIETVTGGVTTPETMISAIYEFQFEGRLAEYFVVSSTAMTEVPDPTDEQLTEFYEAHTDRYMRPEYRALTFLTLGPDNVADQVEVTEAMIEEAYGERIGVVVSGDTRALKQILVDSEPEARSAFDAIAGGTSFIDAAAAAGMAGSDIDLGNVDRDSIAYLGEAAVDAAFTATVGSVTSPIETDLGWVVFQIDEAAETETTPLEDIRDELVAEITEREAGFKLDDLIAVAGEELAAGATVEDLAETLSVEVGTAEEINREGRDSRGDIVVSMPASAKFFDTAFSRDVDEFIDLESDDDKGYFIVRVDSITPAEARPLKEVERQVERDWLAEARGKAAGELAEALAEEARTGGDMTALAGRAGALVTSTPSPFYRTMQNRPAPFTAEIVNNLFAADEGGIVSGPNLFGNGHIVARLSGVRPAQIDRESETYTTTEQAIRQSLRNDIFVQYEAYLYDEHSVSRNPAMIAQMLNTDQ